jgi:hypothetical protein
MVFHGCADMMFVGGETFTLWRITPIAMQTNEMNMSRVLAWRLQES